MNLKTIIVGKRRLRCDAISALVGWHGPTHRERVVWNGYTSSVEGTGNRHDRARWLRRFREFAAIAHDALELEDRARAIAVLAEIVPVEIAIWIATPEMGGALPITRGIAIDTETAGVKGLFKLFSQGVPEALAWGGTVGPYAADDAEATLALYRAVDELERERGELGHAVADYRVNYAKLDDI